MLLAWLLLFAGQPETEQDRMRQANEIDARALNLIRDGHAGEAARLLAKSLKIWEELSENPTVDLVAPHFNLASAYLALGRIAAAQHEAHLARSLITRNTPPDRVRGVRSFIAYIHFHKHEYAEAERELRAILPEMRGLERSTALNDLGMVRGSMSDLEGARHLLENAVAERVQLEPAGSPHLGQFMANLALVHYKQGDMQAAASLYKQAISMLEKAPPGLVRLRLGMALAEYSRVLRKSGRKAEAKTFEERARLVFRDNPNPSINTVDVMSLR